MLVAFETAAGPPADAPPAKAPAPAAKAVAKPQPKKVDKAPRSARTEPALATAGSAGDWTEF